MIKRIICIGVVLVMVFASFMACNNSVDGNNGNEYVGLPILFNVSYEENFGFFSGDDPFDEIHKYNMNELIDSLEALIELSNDNDYQFFNEDDSRYNWDISQKIREYDDNYFQSKELILIFNYQSSGPHLAEIDSVNIKDNTLRVTIARPIIEVSNCMESLYIFLIEVDKNDVEGANNVEAVQITKGQMEEY